MPKVQDKKLKQPKAPNIYTFNVVIEPDEDKWFAYAPALESNGGATWGRTQEEALVCIQEVVEMVVESLLEHGEPIPVDEPSFNLRVSVAPKVKVIVA